MDSDFERATTGICEHCGERPGRLRPDPYDEDVNNRVALQYICGPCYELACDEI
ncbi:hypothetical protein ABT344_11505 [Micromonospora carbonacea]|uniref:hypothetical protein n=1 Tax=Micromonospora carbonacea TaxID=47853 RepID=UPI00332D00BA